MARTITLRPWQKAALERFAAAAAGSADFLAVATPGAGKTTFALTAARQSMARTPGQRMVVVVPTAHLKHQWARAAVAFDLHLDPAWSARDGRLPSDMHGIITTYQQVATSGSDLGRLSEGAFVVFDELHHAGEDRAWGDAVRDSFAGAARRLALSGTPFRSDTFAIPFVRYRVDEAEPDYEYGYGEALRDRGVVRPVYFPRIDGLMEWSAPDGETHTHSFEDPLGRSLASQRLRTALSAEGEWLPTVLRQAHQQLGVIRKTQPNAAGLVIATDQDHARAIAQILRDRFRVKATVALSDDPDASDRIAEFAAGKSPWIVAVRMVSEGVDIPRLRVGVFATTTTTELFFRQAVGRLVRWTRGVKAQKSFLYIPDDPRLRARAWAIAEQRRHSLRHDDRELSGEAAAGELDADGQPSLFAAISAVATDTDYGDGPDWLYDDDGGDPALDEVLTIDLPPLPTPTGYTPGSGSGGAADDGRTLREQKQHLRDANASRVKLIAHHTGFSHAKVNAELNRASHIRKITEATVNELQRRLDKADQWLAHAKAKRVG